MPVMTIQRREWLALCGGLMAASGPDAWAQAGAAELPSAELFFRRPAYSWSQLSPDGRKVAMLLADKDNPERLAVTDLATLKTSIVASFGDVAVGRFRWVNSERLVLEVQTKLTGPGRVDAGSGLFAVNADGSGFRQLVEAVRGFAKLPDAGVPLLRWDHHLHSALGQQTSDEVLVMAAGEVSKEKVDYFSLKRLNTVTGRHVEVEGPLHTVAWVLDHLSEPRVAVTNQGRSFAVMWRDGQQPWRKLVEFEANEDEGWWPLWLSPQGELFASARHQGKAAVFTVNLKTGQLNPQPVFHSKDFDLYPSLIFRADRLVGVRYTIDAEVTQWIEPAYEALQAAVDARLPSTVNQLSVPRHGDAPYVLVHAFSDTMPTNTLLYNTETKKFTRLGVDFPGIDAKRMGQTEFLRYKARDGRDIPAYLTVPAGAQKRDLPLVVLVHGGPWVRGAHWRWDAQVQFLASRGYAVLQPEFRGSTGYGYDHFRAGWKQWGQAMQTDVADAARWAVAQGIANPRRMAIMGASYGGYATLMGLAQNPELFRAGVNWVGVTDINLMYDVTWSDFNNEWKRLGMPKLVGDQQADAAMLKAASPIENASRIKQPLLMAYGAWDVRVPIIHGEKFRDAVQPHNNQVEWVVYPDEGHGWHKPENQIDFWRRVERFLAKHLVAS